MNSRGSASEKTRRWFLVGTIIFLAFAMAAIAWLATLVAHATNDNQFWMVLMAIGGSAVCTAVIVFVASKLGIRLGGA